MAGAGPGLGVFSEIARRPVALAGAAAEAERTTVWPNEAADQLHMIRRVIAREAARYGIPAGFAHAVVMVESSYDPAARGADGEIGLMQVKPDTARLMGFEGDEERLFHPEVNIRYGMKYLAEAKRRGGGTVCGTILKYNAGHHANGSNPVSERYCSRVKAILNGNEA
jgi:soluble lytic murein transglycosylase-like protein